MGTPHRSSPAGRLFHVDRAGDKARLTALNATTGAQLWQVETPLEYEDYYGYSNGPRASPVVDGDRVYTHGVDGRLQCRRTEDGALLWEVDTQREFGFVQNFFGVASAPLVDGELLHRSASAAALRARRRSTAVKSPATARAWSPSTSAPARCAGERAISSRATPARSCAPCAASVSASTSRAADCSPSTQRPAPSASSIPGARRDSRASTRQHRWWSAMKC